MRRPIIYSLATFLLTAAISLFAARYSFGAEQAKEDQNKLFYAANSLYEKQDYVKAIETYVKILDMGLESGNLYYNIGNGFIKLGKLGYAILCYEKAKRFIPQDSDLKSNLAYARSLVAASAFQIPSKNIIIRGIRKPFKDFNLNAIVICAMIFYIIVVLIAAALILNPLLVKRLMLIFLAFLVLFLLNVGAFAIRYYDEEILKHAIVVQKEVECKYEPIDNSTTYYRLQEGDEVIVLKTRNDWRQIKRLDGKITWIKKGVVEEI